MDRKGIITYLALATLAALALAVFFKASGRPSGVMAGAVYVFMFTPALAALMARSIGRGDYSDSGLALGKLRWYFYAWALSLVMCLIVFAAAWAFGAAHFDLNLGRLAELAPGGQGQAARPPEGMTETQFILIAAIANLTVASVPGILLGLGEEFGWRGFLLPRLLPLGRLRAILIVGFIWWAWHLPLMLVNPAVNKSTSTLGLALSFGLVGAICYGAVLAWIRYASGSIFPVALAHISFNNITSAGVLLMDIKAEAQIILNAVVASAVCWLLWRGKCWHVLPRPDCSVPPNPAPEMGPSHQCPD